MGAEQYSELAHTMHRRPITNGSERSYEMRAKYLKNRVQIYDNVIYVFNVLT